MARKRKTENPFKPYCSEAYSNVADVNRGRIPDLEDVVDELLRLVPEMALSDTIRAAARQAVDAEDDARTTPPGWESQLLLPGWPGPEDGFWKVGDGERVRVGDATASDHIAHLQMVEENERRVVDAARFARGRYYDLEKYYRTGSATVADAVLRWQMEHP